MLNLGEADQHVAGCALQHNMVRIQARQGSCTRLIVQSVDPAAQAESSTQVACGVDEIDRIAIALKVIGIVVPPDYIDDIFRHIPGFKQEGADFGMIDSEHLSFRHLKGKPFAAGELKNRLRIDLQEGAEHDFSDVGQESRGKGVVWRGSSAEGRHLF